MKKILLFAAALCGMTSFAVDPVAVWSGDFNETTKGNYTLSDNGNTVAADGSSITISTTATKGVLVDISPASTTGKTTLLVKYSGLSTPSSNAVLLSGAMNSQIKDLVGVAVKTDGSISNIWDNNADSRGSVDSSVAVPQAGIVAFTYDGNNSTASNKGGAFYVKTASGMARKAQSLGSLFSTGNPVNGFAIGGKRASGSLGVIPGLVIEGVAIFDSVLSTTDMAAYEFSQKESSSTPVLLINIGTTTAVDGWLAHNQTEGEWIPTKTTKLSQGDVTFQVSKSTFGGNFSSAAGFGSPVTTTFESGSYSDVFGKRHDSIFDEIKTSLGLSADITESIYTTGVINGGQSSHVGTIGGLDASAKYIVYVGQGYKKKDGNDTHSFKIDTDGYATVEGLDYAVTVNGTGTAKNAQYTSFEAGTTLQPGINGLLIVRMKGIVPKEDGTIAFSMPTGRSGLNFLAVAKVNESATKAELEYEGDVTVSGINKDLVATDNKAEVTLTAGATVYFDAALQVPTKLICEGSITLSANEKPSDLTKLDLSGVTGGAIRTWMTEAEKMGIGFNFASKRGPITTAALVADAAWYDNNDGGSNDEGKTGSNVAMSSDGLTTITWSSANTYDDDASSHGANSSASMVRGYLDDSQGVSITVKNVPFEEYSLIIYASTDNGDALSYKTVNNKDYTANGDSDVAIEGTDSWGKQQSSGEGIAYGRNAIRIVGLKGSTLTINSQRRDADTKKIRGCISAIQIVPYSTFVAPTVTIASVTTQYSEDYTSNTISGTIADYDANSWEGDLTARVVVNSTVYESEAIKDNAFTIEVTGLDRETVYRTVLEVGYTEKDVFTAIATKSLALYQGEQKFVWIASPFVIQEKTLVNDAQGLMIENPFEDPDYIDLCDSEFTVSISASEAVDAENDAALDGTEQGGVRIAQTSSGLKLQVVVDGAWTDFANAAVDTTYTLKVKFHYEKSQEGETDATSVTYALDSATKTSTNPTGKLKVTEIFVSDGTKLPNDLLGACQLDKAVIVDIEIEPGDEVVGIEADNYEKAQEIAAKLKVGISEAVAAVLTTAEQQAAYRAYFKIIAVKAEDGSYTAQVAFADGVESDIEKDIAEALDDVIESFNTGAKVEIAAKPGLYYGVKRGDALNDMDVRDPLTLAGSDGKVTITITKPEKSNGHFYRIIVSPTPSETK